MGSLLLEGMDSTQGCRFSFLLFSDALQSLPPSSKTCKELLIPLTCLFRFPICEGGAKYVPSQQLCESISAAICAEEWAVASSVNENNLPSCGDLPDGMYALLCEDASLGRCSLQ